MVCVVPPEQHSSWIGYKEKRRWHPNEKERVKLRKNERCEVRYGSLAGKCRDCKGDRGLAGVPGFQAEASDLSCLRVLAYLRWVSSSPLSHLLHKVTKARYLRLRIQHTNNATSLPPPRGRDLCPSLMAFFTIKCFFSIYTNNSGIQKHNSLS